MRSMRLRNRLLIGAWLGLLAVGAVKAQTVGNAPPIDVSANVNSVANSDGTLTISPTTGAVVASINHAHNNSWTLSQSINLSTAALFASTNWTVQAADGSVGSTYGVSSSATNSFEDFRTDGTYASPTTLVSGNEIGYFGWGGYDGTVVKHDVADIRGVVTGTWVDGSDLETEVKIFATPPASITSENEATFQNGVGLGTLATKGQGTINVAAQGVYNNGTAPTGTGGGYVLATSPTIASPTATGSFTATGLVTNADLANPATTVNGQTCTLGSTCTVGGGITSVSTGLMVTSGALTSNATDHVSFQPGLMTSVINAKAGFHKFSKASTVNNIEGSAQQFSCTGNPTITMFECGTSTTCATPTTIGTVTVTAAATVVDGTVSNPAITAGDYVAFAVSSGTCVTLDVAATAQTSQN
jgi:hypothetical protein